MNRSYGVTIGVPRDPPYGAPCATLGFRLHTARVILSVVELLWLATKARGKAEVGSRAVFRSR